MKLSIIITVYNEKNTIREIVKKVESVDLGQVEKEIIIVDDFSSDGTRDILATLEQKNLIIIYHEKNYGKGRALRSGFSNATGDWVVPQDADLEYDPQDLKALVDKISETGVAVVYGSRVRHDNYFKIRKSGHIFALGGFFLTWLTNFLYGTKITDEPTCYKMFRRDFLPALDLQCERFEFCPEITAKIARKKIKIYEVPINYYPRHKNEGKKIKWRDGLKAVITLLKYRF